MKTMISALLSTLIITLAIAGNVNAQKTDNNVYFTTQSNYTDENASAATANTNASKASLKASKANSKAQKEFSSSYKDASGVNWSTSKDAMFASFTKNNVKTDVVYNKNGKWLHTITYYQTDKTPQNIADIIDYAYPKDEIKQTTKVEEGNMEFYIVQLEGKTTYKKVTVYNGETNVIEELNKGN